MQTTNTALAHEIDRAIEEAVQALTWTPHGPVPADEGPIDIDPEDLEPIPDEGATPLRGTPTGLAQVPIRPRSWAEHLEAIEDRPLDAAHLLFRSQLPPEEVAADRRAAAALVKARHDLHCWTRGEAPWRREGQELDRGIAELLALLDEHRPSPRHAGLREAWTNMRRILGDMLVKL